MTVPMVFPVLSSLNSLDQKLFTRSSPPLGESYSILNAQYKKSIKVQDGTWTFEHEFLKKLLMCNVYLMFTSF